MIRSSIFLTILIFGTVSTEGQSEGNTNMNVNSNTFARRNSNTNVNSNTFARRSANSNTNINSNAFGGEGAGNVNMEWEDRPGPEEIARAMVSKYRGQLGNYDVPTIARTLRQIMSKRAAKFSRRSSNSNSNMNSNTFGGAGLPGDLLRQREVAKPVGNVPKESPNRRQGNRGQAKKTKQRNRNAEGAGTGAENGNSNTNVNSNTNQFRPYDLV